MLSEPRAGTSNEIEFMLCIEAARIPCGQTPTDAAPSCRKGDWRSVGWAKISYFNAESFSPPNGTHLHAVEGGGSHATIELDGRTQSLRGPNLLAKISRAPKLCPNVAHARCYPADRDGRPRQESA